MRPSGRTRPEAGGFENITAASVRFEPQNQCSLNAISGLEARLLTDGTDPISGRSLNYAFPGDW
jgi:hypothetical protein